MAMKKGSLCELGKSAPNPVLSTLKYFREEYEAHIKDHKCPAGVCNNLINYSIISDKCTGCHLCSKVCPSDAIVGGLKEKHSILQEKCIKCGACIEVCNFDAIIKE
jgi:NADP-reducing hydrogenase subunit HndC